MKKTLTNMTSAEALRNLYKDVPFETAMEDVAADAGDIVRLLSRVLWALKMHYMLLEKEWPPEWLVEEGLYPESNGDGGE